MHGSNKFTELTTYALVAAHDQYCVMGFASVRWMEVSIMLDLREDLCYHIPFWKRFKNRLQILRKSG